MKPHILLLIYIVLNAINVRADNIHFQTLGSVQGMSQSSAISIWQDHLGRMWFGNDALNCYDGETVKVYRLSDYFEEIEDANLHTITGNDSLLFVIAENQLISFDLRRESFHLTGVQTNSVYCKGEYLYYFSSGYFCRYNTKTQAKEELVSMPSSVLGVRAIESCGENRLFLATPVGGFQVDVESRKIIGQPLATENLVCLLKDSDDNLWITTQSGRIYLVTNIYSDSWDITTFHIEDKAIRQTNIYALKEDRNGSVWLGTLSGLFQVRRQANRSGEYTLETLRHVMSESTVFALYTDRQGTLWIGSYYGDVRYFNPEVDNYRYYATDEDHPDRLHGAVIGDMVEDKEGNLYIITEGSGMNIYHASTNKFSHLTTNDGLRHNKIRYIWYDELYDRLYLSEYMKGISYCDIKTKKINPIESGVLSTLYQHIIEEIKPYRNYLILLTQDGLFRLDRGDLSITHLFSEPELREACSGIIRSIHIDEKGILWVSSFERGLFTIDMKTRKIVSSYGDGLMEGSVIPSAIVSFAENPQKGLFLTTLKSGVLRYEPQTHSFKRITEEQQLLLSDICYKMTFSRYGNLIVTTNKGVSILNISPRGQINVVHHIRLSPSFPLKALSVDCGLYTSPRNNMIWVGGLYGLFSFSEENLGMENDNYSLYYSSLWINNSLQTPVSGVIEKNLPYLNKIVLPYNKNTLNLTFASTNYLSTRNSWHEYKMEGLEDMWTMTNHKNIIFNSLRPGKYKLLLREVGNEYKKAELAITIKPPFWATTPAILLYIVLLLLTLLAIIKFNKSKALLKISLDLERKEVQRIEEANRNKMDFFINISNEFRTPLTLITSQLERLAYEIPPKGKKRLEKVRTQANRLQDLISELLDFRKIESNRLQLHVAKCNLNDFLRKIYMTYADVAEERHIRYRYKQLTQFIELWLDKKQMQKVIYNLLAFVFRYASEKSTVELIAHVRNKWVEIQMVYDGDFPDHDSVYYLFRLINDENSVQPDLSLLPEGGMGIAFSKGIIHLHKGNFSIWQEDGKTYFLICLPLGSSHFSLRELESLPETMEPEPWDEITTDEPEAEDEIMEIEMEEKDMHLLIVEADDEVRSLLKDSFSFIYNVTECTDAMSAYEHAQDKQPDLIITEANIPGMNGAEFCNALKSNIRTLHIPLVVVSSKPSEKQKADCIRNGADVYIVKPFNLQSLLLRCNSLVKYRKKILRQGTFTPVVKEEMDVATNIRDKNFMTLANQIIEDNMGNPDFDTTFWSKQLGIGRTRLFSQIKNITGMTPNDYILHLKMNKGALLLKETDLNVSEVAYQLGFSIPAYFSKCFKKQFGVTPAEFRKR